MNKLLDDDLKNLNSEEQKIFFKEDGKSISSDHLYEFNNSTYKGIAVKELETRIPGKGEENKIKYSLESGCDNILGVNIAIKIKDIKVKNESNCKIRLKNNFILSILKCVTFIVPSCKKEYRITPNYLKVYYNFFNANIIKKDYKRIIGSSFDNSYSKNIPKYKCNFLLPFFFSEDSSLSFPESTLTPIPHFEIDLDTNVCNIIDMIDEDKNIIEGDDIKLNLASKKSKIICKPKLTVDYSLLSTLEKEQFKFNERRYFRNIDDSSIKPISEIRKDDFRRINKNKNNDDCSNHFSISSENSVLAIIFHGPKNSISNISCYKIKDDNIIYRFDNINYEKSSSFLPLHYYRSKNIEKNTYISLNFSNKVSGINSSSIFNIKDYVFVINMKKKSEAQFSDIKVNTIFFDSYSIPESKRCEIVK